MEYVFKYPVRNQVSNRKCLLELINGRLEVHQRNMSQKRGLNFDQLKALSENYKLIRALLWLVYKIAKNFSSGSFKFKIRILPLSTK